MGIKFYKPTTPSRRHTSVLTSDDITGKKSVKKLIVARSSTAGRNNTGRITVRHRGGARNKIRVIDFKRDKFDIPAKVAAVEYDPNRNTRIALLNYADGEKRYMIVPANLKIGDIVLSSKKLIELKSGNHLPLKLIPPGMFVYNIELTPGAGGQMARSAGNSAYLMGFDQGRAQLRLPSSEVRTVSEDCLATIGVAGNADFKNIRWGRAGRKRHQGVRPTVRGKVMNPVDHPHGGGEGRNPIGLKHPKTPWGKPALGVKTRKESKKSWNFILERRKKNK